MFAVVLFTIADDLAVVPCSWLAEGEATCLWPPFKSDAKIHKAVKASLVADDNWIKHACRVLVKNGAYI